MPMVPLIVIDPKPAARPGGTVRALIGRVARAGRAELARQRTTIDPRDVAAILRACAERDPEARGWVVLERHGGDPAIVLVGPRRGTPGAVVRVGRSQAARAGLVNARAALETLGRVLGDSSAAALVPVVLASGEIEAATWLAERTLTGRPGRALLGETESRRWLLQAAAATIDTLHGATARSVVVGPDEIERWIDDRARQLAERLGAAPASAGSRDAVARVASAAAEAIRGRSVVAGWIHGDLWPANVLVDPDRTRITGLIDWDSAARDELALHDRLHLALTTRRLVERKDLGAVLVALLEGKGWTDDDRAVLGHAIEAAPGATGSLDGIPIRTALWLYWLRFVVTNIARHPDLASNRRWVAANVEQVLAWG